MKFAVVLALLAVASAQRTVTLDPEKAEESAGCRPGELVVFSITSNASTGYQWFFVPPNSQTASLQNGNTGTYVQAETGLVGAPGRQEFHVQCSSQAQTNDAYQFTLIKKRAWETTSLRSKTVTLVVE